MEKTIASLTQKVKNWKEIFIKRAKIDGLTVDSSWVSIMEKVSLSPFELLDITAQASVEVGPFDVFERDFLQSLPWYHIVKTIIPQVDPNALEKNQFHMGETEDTYNVLFIYHKKDLHIFECYIIEPEAAEEVKTDLLISYFDIGTVACISFVKDIPEHFKIEMVQGLHEEDGDSCCDRCGLNLNGCRC